MANTGGWIHQSFNIRATAVEVLVADTDPDEDVVLIFLGLNVVVNIPRAEAARVAADILNIVEGAVT